MTTHTDITAEQTITINGTQVTGTQIAIAQDLAYWTTKATADQGSAEMFAAVAANFAPAIRDNLTREQVTAHAGQWTTDYAATSGAAAQIIAALQTMLPTYIAEAAQAGPAYLDEIA